MAGDERNAEIEALRKQLDELKRERGAERLRTAQPDGEPQPTEAAAEQQAAVDEADRILETIEEIGGDLATHLKALLETLDEDLKNTRPSTLLIVFVLGVLVGRLR